MNNYEKNELLTYKEGLKYVKEKGLALDIGACVGLWTLWMAKDFESVFAFEPAPLNFDELYKNCHHIKNIYLNSIAISNKKELIKLYNATKNFDKISGHWQLNEPLNKDFKSVKILSDTLDNNVSINFPNYIKIDVQGAELDVLKGAENTLRRCSPVLNIEVIQNTKYNGKIKKFLSKLEYNSVKRIHKHEIFSKC